MNNKKRLLVPISAALSLTIVSPACLSQSTPSEFAEMSLSELFEESIDDPESIGKEKSPWTIALQYKMVEFERYLDGRNNLSFNEVLWEGPGEIRTKDNFPVVPTRITQKATILALGYQFDENWRYHLSIPHIEQNTDHISIVADYDEFAIETSGIGDVVLSASHKLVDTATSTWWLSLGVSLPTGSIDEKGDTPRAPGDQQLPYTMQLGSGTYDFPLEISYQSLGEHDWNLSFSANIRTGENDRDYRLGNNYGLSARYEFHPFPTVHPFVGLDYQYSDSIHGKDRDLLVNAVFPYPASITNPDFYGGKKVNMRVGVSLQIFGHYRLVAEFGKPLDQDLNGPQPKEDWRSSIQISRTL